MKERKWGPRSTCSEMRAYLLENAHRRVECPVCEQRVEPRRRTLSPMMARFMLGLYHMSKGRAFEWCSSRKLTNAGEKASTDASYLDRWGLVERDGSGGYCLTDSGLEFVEGSRSVPKAIFIKAGKVDGRTDERVTIRDVLPNVDLDEELSRT